MKAALSGQRENHSIHFQGWRGCGMLCRHLPVPQLGVWRSLGTQRALFCTLGMKQSRRSSLIKVHQLVFEDKNRARFWEQQLLWALDHVFPMKATQDPAGNIWNNLPQGRPGRGEGAFMSLPTQTIPWIKVVPLQVSLHCWGIQAGRCSPPHPCCCWLGRG